MSNWLPSTLGPMSIRPGTKYFGSSRNDTGAEFVEFVASTDDVALLEVTDATMRVWLGEDAHALELLSRPAVDTQVSLSDTGWVNASTGGAFVTVASNIIPTFIYDETPPYAQGGVKVTASSENVSINDGGGVTSLFDGSTINRWMDTGIGNSALPSWVNVDFDTGANVTDRKAITSYAIRPDDGAANLSHAPRAWRLITGNFDTGTFATDTGKWTLEDERTAETGWSASERRTYTLPGADTGTVEARRHWRLYVTAIDGATDYLMFNELEMYTAATALQVRLQGGQRILNATAIGSRAIARKRVIVSDTGTEHALAIAVGRGPVTLRVGSTEGNDDYISESALGTGAHDLAFTPLGNFHITLQSDAVADRIVSSLSIGSPGTVEVAAPWARSNLDNIRYDQSADVIFVDCDGVQPSKIERRGIGRSWSVVKYEPDDGPFLPARSSSAKLAPLGYYGNTTMVADVPYFTPTHVGAMVRIFHEGQSGKWALGNLDAATDVIEVTGLADTGTDNNNERRITVSASGAWNGRIAIERSIGSGELGFKPLDFDTGASTDTGTFSRTIDDPDNNLTVRYRVRMSAYTSGVAEVAITYPHGGVTGVARITGYNSNQNVDIEVLSRFSDTGFSANWQEGYWSDRRGYPTAVALHGGRLAHAQGGSIFLSVADDYESFDESVEGDAGPIIRTLGSGPVDRIRYLVSLLRLLIGTAGAELTARASSLDEPLTPSNTSAAAVSTQGSANIRALKMDTRALMVQRSGSRVYMVGPAQNTLADYEAFDLTQLVPDLLKAGVRSVAVQRQPDTRLHCVLGDGTVAILTYEPTEEVICWFTWDGRNATDSDDGCVERAMVLPGIEEDAVFYHIRRSINGSTRRYLEKWALESECVGDTGLTWLMDCAVSMSDAGGSATVSAPHLAGKSVIAWGDDTGAGGVNPWFPDAGRDLSPDVDGVQTTYLVDTGTGNVTLPQAQRLAVVGLPYEARWKSSKLAYAAEIGTALAQMKRAPQLALSLYGTHHRGLLFGSDTGRLDPLPRVIEGEQVDPDRIFNTLDKVAVPSPSNWQSDARLYLRAKAPRPVTVLAAIPTIVTHDR